MMMMMMMIATLTQEIKQKQGGQKPRINLLWTEVGLKYGFYEDL
jgi:hypothetical protein